MALAFFQKRSDPLYPSKDSEQRLDSVAFNVFKFNNRPKPQKTNRIKVVSCFSEFGCETLGCMYCIPRLLRRYPGQYIIAMGWYGREYLYRHLVDEFWELKEEFMWLRDHARAFHHESFNLKRIEEAATKYGEVVPSVALGKYAIANMCRTCGMFWQEWRCQTKCCPACKSTVLVRSVFTDVATYKPQARRIPRPSPAKLEWAAKLVPERSVGVFARARKTYGRNLPASFYVDLISLLKNKGYTVVWLGEKQSTLPCPVPGVLDFSRMEESRDLESTLAIISHLDFTLQFWTASTRLSAMVDVPFLLIESPEQIYCSLSGLMGAQEGKRLELTTFAPYKLVLSHYLNFLEDQKSGLGLVDQAIDELKAHNYEPLVGLVQDRQMVDTFRREYEDMLT